MPPPSSQIMRRRKSRRFRRPSFPRHAAPIVGFAQAGTCNARWGQNKLTFRHVIIPQLSIRPDIQRDNDEGLDMSERSMDALFEPFELGDMKLGNRIVMAPMTRSFSPSGIPGQNVADYYKRRAEGGVGLIITEGTAVDRSGAVDSDHIPRFHGEEALVAWQKVRDEVKSAGGTIAPQLWHVGAAPRQDHHVGAVPGRSESPSGRFSAAIEHGEAMTDSDIADTIEAFASASADAKRLGFGAVEFHGAHGYLFDQFFWDICNRRNDEWGGATLPTRTRFASEVVRAARQRLGPDFPIILRISQWKQQDYSIRLAENPTMLEQWLAPLVNAGVDIFDCSQRRFWVPEFEGDDRNLAGWVKAVTGKATITVGSVGLETEFMSTHGSRELIQADAARLDDLIRRMERGDFDLVAVGRALLADPRWPEKIRSRQYDQLVDYSIECRERLY